MRKGELDFGSRSGTAFRAAVIQAAALPAQILGVSRTTEISDLFDAPKSRLAEESLSRAREELSPSLLAHSLRCWQWAMAFACIDSSQPDREALYSACVLHDIALGADADAHYGCFAALGARWAEEFVADQSDAEQAKVVATAIAHHMDPDIASCFGDEAALLHDAAHLDVAGYRARDLEPAFIHTVVGKHPRDGFSKEFGVLMCAESKVRPKSTAAVLWRNGMSLPLRINPLDRLKSDPVTSH